MLPVPAPMKVLPVLRQVGATLAISGATCRTWFPAASTARRVGDAIGGAAVLIVKLKSETSKKTLPTAWIFTRALDVARTGTVIACVPSLAVLAVSTKGKV